MKIALVALNGSFSHTNLAIRCLRDALEQKGFPVTLSEHTVKDRTAHVLEALYRIDADVYGFSCYIWNVEAMLSLAASLHALRPTVRIVLGGPEASYAVERFTDLSYVDAVVCGEGETVMTELCSLWREGKEAARVLYGLPADNDVPSGILYRTDESTGRLLYYESSRGCPYNCAYCLSSATRGVRMKSVEQTLAELEAFEHLSGKGQIIKLVDRTFNADVKRANAIWRALLEDRFTKTYHFEICATLLDEESFAILSRFPKGKIQLECGLQSTDPETLAAVSRHVDPVRVLENVRRIHRMGNIHVHLDLIAGLPYEDYDRFARSFDDAYGSSDMLQLGFLKLLHGTELRRRMEEYGYACLSTPPYTVLQSKWMHYGELCRLSRIAELLERYLESGRFAHALWYLTPLMSSPFRFWEGLSLWLEAHDGRPLQRISQPDAFRYLLEYAREYDARVDEGTLKRMLAADFSQGENKNPPYFLK